MLTFMEHSLRSIIAILCRYVFWATRQKNLKKATKWQQCDMEWGGWRVSIFIYETIVHKATWRGELPAHAPGNGPPLLWFNYFCTIGGWNMQSKSKSKYSLQKNYREAWFFAPPPLSILEKYETKREKYIAKQSWISNIREVQRLVRDERGKERTNQSIQNNKRIGKI